MDSPPPVQKPHPPILIGGGGERKTLRMVAQYADPTHQTTSEPAVMRHKMEVLRARCERLGRNYDEIERYCGLDLRPSRGRSGRIADSATLLERAAELDAAGAQGVFVVLPKVADSESIEMFGRDVIGHA